MPKEIENPLAKVAEAPSDVIQEQENRNGGEATTTIQDYKYSDVDFRVTGYPFEPSYSLAVFQDGKKVFTGGNANEISNCPTIWVEETKKCQDVVTFGIDMTGNGNKDFVFEYDYFGSYDPVNYSIFELTRQGNIKEI